MSPSVLPPQSDDSAPTRKSGVLPDGEPLCDIELQPVQLSLATVQQWSMREFNFVMLVLLWLAYQPLWPDFRLLLLQACLAGACLVILYGTSKWTLLFYSIDWKGPLETTQGMLEQMRAIRVRQLGRMTLLFPLILASTVPLLIQQSKDWKDKPERSVVAALAFWGPFLLLPMIELIGGMWRFTGRLLQVGWHTPALRQQPLDGGSLELWAKARADVELQGRPAEATPCSGESAHQTAISCSSIAQSEYPPDQMPLGSVLAETGTRRPPVLDRGPLRESVLQPVRRALFEAALFPAIEMICILAMLALCSVTWGQWSDPRMTLCQGVGIASCLAYLVFHAVWFRRCVTLDWNGPLEQIQSTLEGLQTMRLHHLRWTSIFVIPLGLCPTLILSQLLFDKAPGNSESVFSRIDPWLNFRIILILMFSQWFVLIPFHQTAVLKLPIVLRFLDGGALLAFHRARSEMERCESRASDESVTGLLEGGSAPR